jgi:hypothetical protein
LIGELVVKCSTLDRFALVALAGFLRLDPVIAERVFARDTGRGLCERLSIVVEMKVDEEQLRERWKHWIEEVNGVRDRRNEVVHALWAVDGEGVAGTQLRPKGPRSLEFVADDVNATVSTCGQLEATWMALFNAMVRRGIAAMPDEEP